MNVPEYREALLVILERVKADHPDWSVKKQRKCAEKLARDFVVELKFGLIKQ